jgi:hypothetical protein
MESASPRNGPEPLGKAFYLLLLVPIVSLALVAAFGSLGWDGVAIVLLVFALLAMPFCSALGASLVRAQNGIAAGLLIFFGAQFTYAFVLALGLVMMFDIGGSVWEIVCLIGYGIFRFGHEFLRATPRVMGGLSGYHLAAILVVILGTVGFVRRRHAQRRSP